MRPVYVSGLAVDGRQQGARDIVAGVEFVEQFLAYDGRAAEHEFLVTEADQQNLAHTVHAISP